MKFILKDVTPHYIEHDIVRNGGTKILDSYYLIQYFDFVMNGQKQFSIPKNLPEQSVKLFTQLKAYAKNKKTLDEQSKYLFMKEAYDTCSIVLHSFDPKQKKPFVTHRIEFPKSEWANLEDMFLEAGLAVCKRTENRTMRYELRALEAHYELIIEGDNTTLTIKAPDEDKLIDSLTVIGHSVDEGKMEGTE